VELMKLPLWKNLFEVAMSWEYDSIHQFEEIEKILNLPYGTSRFRTAISQANDELTKSGKRLKNVRGIGYQVLKPGEYLDESVKHLKKGTNQIKKSVDIITGAPIHLLEPYERSNYVAHKDFLISKFVEGVSDVSNWIHIAKNPESVPKLPRR